MTPKPPNWLRPSCIAVAALLTAGIIAGTLLKPEFWFTADQQAQRLFSREDYKGAAEKARDPLLAGAAWYRAGEFKQAATSFALSTKPEGAFNLGNARVLLGKYDDAVAAYDDALRMRPEWPEAISNRELARLRAKAMETKGGDMTGGKLKADEIVFNKGPNKSGGQDETTEGDAPTSDLELQAVWLRRLDTKPADFLRSKFAFQAAKKEEP